MVGIFPLSFVRFQGGAKLLQDLHPKQVNLSSPPGHVPPPEIAGHIKGLLNPYFWGGYVRAGVG